MLRNMEMQGSSSSNSVPESKGSDQLIIGAETDVVTLDPGRCYETSANTLMRACYDTLFDMPTRSEEPNSLFGERYSSILMMDLR
ncbi:MAG: hypothetical protein V8S01_03160 [Dorea sp.]